MFEYSTDGFVNTDGANEIQRIYSQDQPIYTTDTTPAGSAGSLDKMTATLNHQQTATNPVLTSRQIRSTVPSQQLQEKQAVCAMSGTDSFEALSQLASNYDPKSMVRCGWIYNNANPQQGRGAVGVSQGPYVPANGTSVQGTWMWDLVAAKKKYHTWLCKQVTSCGQLLNAPYNGRCGWCASSGTAVPITPSGAVAYPSDPTVACSASSLLIPTAANNTCPAPSAAAQAALGWNYLPNGNLPRAALIQQAQQAGCSDQATLIQALQSGSDTNYFSALAQRLAYTTYQGRALPSMNERQLKNGNVVIGQALAEFQQVKSQADSTTNDLGLRAAARDLCLTPGTMETYDFCTEISDSTPGPYTIDCLQKQFLRAGGQRSGRMYPSMANIASWNAKPTWGAVKKAMTKMYNNAHGSSVEGFEGTPSIDRTTQAEAIADFYGVEIETTSPLGKVPGVEIFWFTNIYNDVASPTTIFLGRRIRPTIPFINQSNDLPGTNNLYNISMVFFTNFSFPNYNGIITCRATSDDGFGLVLGNQPLGLGFRNGLQKIDQNSLIALGYFPPTTFNATWNLTANRPNKFSGLWFQGGGGLYFKFEYNNGRTWQEVPAENLNLTQEAYAPMMSFQVYRNPQNFGADFNFADTRMGALKMKWTANTGTPSWSYAGGPLSLPYVNFKPDSSMKMVSMFKLYSFMTLTMLVTFNAMPNNSVNTQDFLVMPGNSVPSITIRLSGNGTYGQGRAQLLSNGEGSSYTQVIQQGVPYLLVFRVNRATLTDIYSVNGVSLGLEKLSVLQKTPSISYTSLQFQNSRTYSNPDTQESRSMVVGNSDINVSWIRLYDYYLDSNAIGREVNNTWQYL